MLTELGVLVDESEGLYAGVLLFVEVFDVVDEFDGFDGVGRGVAEEVLIAALGELSGAGASAEEYLLRAFGDGAGGLRRGAVVASDYREDAFLIIKTLGFRLRDVRLALVVGLDYLDDVLSAEESFSGGERRVDLGVGLVDEVGGGKDGINAVLSRDGGGAGQREEGSDLDLFCGERGRGEQGRAKYGHSGNDDTFSHNYFNLLKF